MSDENKVEYLQFKAENESISELFKIPHTWQDVGAAPGGYGLGSKSSLEIYDLNQCIQNGWYRINEKIQPEYYASIFPYGAVHVIARSSSDIMQRIVNFGGAPYEMLRYTTNGGETWFEEWINPPMALGVEYRTTERFIGKPVYVRMLDIGNLGAVNSLQTKSIPVLNKDYVIRYDFISNYTNIMLNPHITYLQVNDNTIEYKHNSDYFGQHTIVTYLIIYYTKKS